MKPEESDKVIEHSVKAGEEPLESSTSVVRDPVATESNPPPSLLPPPLVTVAKEALDYLSEWVEEVVSSSPEHLHVTGLMTRLNKAIKQWHTENKDLPATIEQATDGELDRAVDRRISRATSDPVCVECGQGVGYLHWATCRRGKAYHAGSDFVTELDCNKETKS